MRNIDGVVSGDDLKRLAQALDLAYSADLSALLRAEEIFKTTIDDPNRVWLHTLANSGLTRFRVLVKPVGGGTSYYEVTELGTTLWNAWQYAPNL